MLGVKKKIQCDTGGCPAVAATEVPFFVEAFGRYLSLFFCAHHRDTFFPIYSEIEKTEGVLNV